MAGMRSWFRKSTRLQTALDMSVLKTDIHSHLIPGIDDGSHSLEESLELIASFVRLGFKKLVTTPHIMTDYYRNTPSIIQSGLDDLRRIAKARGLAIEIEAAAEYMIDGGFEEKLSSKELLTFGQNFVLIEFSYLNPPNHYKQLIFDLRTEGYKVVLAHPERYAYWNQQWDVFEDLCDRGVYLQLNAVSLAGFYGDQVKAMAEQLVDRQLYSFAGSDAHNTDYMNSFEMSRYELYMEKLINSGRLLNSSI